MINEREQPTDLVNPLDSLLLYLIKPSLDEPVKKFLETYLIGKEGRFLDIGCGSLPKTYWPRSSLRKAFLVDLENSPFKQFRKIIAGGLSLPFPDNSFDVTLSKQVINYIADVDRFLGEMVRVTRRDGDIILIALNEKITSKVGNFTTEFNFDRFKNKLTNLGIEVIRPIVIECSWLAGLTGRKKS